MIDVSLYDPIPGPTLLSNQTWNPRGLGVHFNFNSIWTRSKKGAVKFHKLVPKNVTILTKQAIIQCLFVLEVWKFDMGSQMMYWSRSCAFYFKLIFIGPFMILKSQMYHFSATDWPTYVFCLIRGSWAACETIGNDSLKYGRRVTGKRPRYNTKITCRFKSIIF